jgi:signal transduction histidine kinase
VTVSDTPLLRQDTTIDSSRIKAERAMTVVLGVFRLGMLVQVLFSLVSSTIRSEIVWGSAVAGSVVVVWNVILFGVVIKQKSFAATPTWMWLIDFVVAAQTVIVVSQALPSSSLIGTWAFWPYAYICATAPTFAIWPQPIWRSMTLSVLLAVIYGVTVFPGNETLIYTIINNAASVVIYTLISAIGASFIRRLAQTADQHKERAIALEQERHRFHMHDVTGLLNRLSQEDIPPEALAALRTQALRESNRLRYDITSASAATPNELGSPTVESVISASLKGFGHLPLEIRTHLGQDISLHPDTAVALESALISLLYNIQFHAGQVQEVIIHSARQADGWEVSICDDGVGFDLEQTPMGFGLKRQVIAGLQSQGLTVTVETAPGEGTCVFIHGPLVEPH